MVVTPHCGAHSLSDDLTSDEIPATGILLLMNASGENFLKIHQDMLSLEPGTIVRHKQTTLTSG